MRDDSVEILFRSLLQGTLVSSSAMGRNDPALLVPMLSYDSKINAVAMGVDRI